MTASSAILERFLALHPKRIDLSLERIETLLAKLGNPQKKLPPVIHVAGTNGKGSTCAFLRAILEAAGKRVHVYTSPHLVNIHERVRLAGTLVTEPVLVDAFERAEKANGGEAITVFEITTAASFLLFSEVPADVLILEVGLGGRFDATNVINDPIASVITPISFDHKDFLGDTLARIAWSKAGIIKKNVPVIIGPQQDEAADVIEAEIRSCSAPAHWHGQDYSGYEEHGRFVFQDGHGLLDLPLPRLPGRHQITNAAGAIAALRAVLPDVATSSAIERGLATVDWPARMQRLTGALTELAPTGSELWLDGGHNADGGRVLAAAFAELEERAPRPLIMIVGMLTSKEADQFLKNFSGLAQRLFAVAISSQDHAARSADDIANTARAVGLPAASAGDLAETLTFIASETWPVPPRILITGSLYLAGEVLQADNTLPN
jgi:dihydrofolate synthase / folylpolyglutamate synthase